MVAAEAERRAAAGDGPAPRPFDAPVLDVLRDFELLAGFTDEQRRWADDDFSNAFGWPRVMPPAAGGADPAQKSKPRPKRPAKAAAPKPKPTTVGALERRAARLAAKAAAASAAAAKARAAAATATGAAGAGRSAARKRRQSVSE